MAVSASLGSLEAIFAESLFVKFQLYVFFAMRS